MAAMAAPSPVARDVVDIQWLREQASHNSPVLYAVIDACGEPAVPEKAAARKENAASLYRGWAETEYWAIAPYLFLINEATLDWIRTDLWEKPWGIFLLSSMDLVALRRHLRHFLLVRDPSGKEMYFRFYDPRVLPTFLENSPPEDVAAFFGEMKSILISDGANVQRFQPAVQPGKSRQ